MNDDETMDQSPSFVQAPIPVNIGNAPFIDTNSTSNKSHRKSTSYSNTNRPEFDPNQDISASDVIGYEPVGDLEEGINSPQDVNDTVAQRNIEPMLIRRSTREKKTYDFERFILSSRT